jgi:hypothetical protein
MEVLLLPVETYLAAVHASFAAKARRKGDANVEASKTHKSLGGIVFAIAHLCSIYLAIFFCVDLLAFDDDEKFSPEETDTVAYIGSRASLIAHLALDFGLSLYGAFQFTRDFCSLCALCCSPLLAVTVDFGSIAT